MIGGISHEAICAVQAYHRTVIERQRQRFEAVSAAPDDSMAEAGSAGETSASTDWQPTVTSAPQDAALPMSV